MRLVLTNAIYFKAAWMRPFSPKQTKNGDFTLADGKKVKSPPAKPGKAGGLLGERLNGAITA